MPIGKRRFLNIPRHLQWIQEPGKHMKRHVTRQKNQTWESAFSFVQLLVPNKPWNVIKAKIWRAWRLYGLLGRLRHYIAWIVPLWVNTFLPSNNVARPSLMVQNGHQNGTERKSSDAMWALVPLSHYIAWIVPLWVNTSLPSNTLARPSLMVQNGHQNGTERKSSDAMWALVPLSHYIAWIIPLWVNTSLPSNTLARPSLMVQNGHQNGTERKSSKDSFHELLISHLKTKSF